MIYEESCYYHLYNRGCNKELIFHGEKDFKKLIEIISESKMDEYLQLCAFSLMPNHYHFLVKQTSSKPVSSWIQFIFNRYVRWYNIKYNRKGTLFEGNVKTKCIDRIEYLGNITHYVHCNPNSELLKSYSSLNFLKDNTIVCLKFYQDFFNDLDEYFIQLKEYKRAKEFDEIARYLFE
jgi:REP element-mobilizing transposase RayT